MGWHWDSSRGVASLLKLTQPFFCHYVQSRLNSFVKGNVDNMLALRQMTERAISSEGAAGGADERGLSVKGS